MKLLTVTIRKIFATVMQISVNIVIRFEGGEEVINICVFLDESFHCVSSYLVSACLKLDLRTPQLRKEPQKPDSFETQGTVCLNVFIQRVCQVLSYVENVLLGKKRILWTFLGFISV
jgi:hypothetical protein